MERELHSKSDEDEKMLRAYMAGAFDEHEYAVRRKLLKEEAARMTEELTRLRSQVMTPEQLEQRKTAILEMSRQMQSQNIPIDPPFEIKQRIIKLVVDEIVLNVTEGWLKLDGTIRGAFTIENTPCPCGYFGDSLRACTCSDVQIRKYQQRISGPMLDRFDIQLDVRRVDYDKLTDDRRGEPSAAIQARVETARERQRHRYRELPHIHSNSDLGPGEIDQFCKMEEAAETLLKTAMRKLQLSARAFHRVMKVSRTIADLAAADVIRADHVAEAVQYRSRTLLSP